MAEQSSLTVAGSDVLTEARAVSGCALVRSTTAGAFHSEPITLTRRSTSVQALASIATSCVRQIALNQRGVLSGSSEAVHQMRVGLRRLRAALSIFKSVFRVGQFDDLKRELVWLTKQLAAARDYDVLIASTRNLEDFTRSAFGGLTELSDELARRHREAFAVAAQGVASARFERLIVSAALGSIVRADEDGAEERAVHDLARKALECRTRRVLRRLGRFSRLGERERHEFRIQVKKLRYATEFFASLYSSSHRAQKRFCRELEALQDALGQMNDIIVHRRIALDVADDSTKEASAGRRIAFAMGALTGREQSMLRELLAGVPKLHARLAAAPHFWR